MAHRAERNDGVLTGLNSSGARKFLNRNLSGFLAGFPRRIRKDTDVLEFADSKAAGIVFVADIDRANSIVVVKVD